MRTSVNKLGVVKKVLSWVSVVISSAVLLIVVNSLAPKKIEVDIPRPPIKLTVGCFIDGNPVFMGDVIGPLVINDNGQVEFFSLEWNSQVTIINAACMAIESRVNQPSVRKEGQDLPHTEKQII